MDLAELALPPEFHPLPVVLPNVSHQIFLGYGGDARYVGFYWDGAAGGTVWEDGQQPQGGIGENFTFLRYIRPLAFLYEVNFGTRGGPATHIFLWDREKGKAYIAPRLAALRFLREQRPIGTMPHPSQFATAPVVLQ
jgi:hypothetical protein